MSLKCLIGVLFCAETSAFIKGSIFRQTSVNQLRNANHLCAVAGGVPYGDTTDDVMRFRQTRRRRQQEEDAAEEARNNERGAKNDPEWSFFDTARINVKGGDGGNGCVAFRREKGVDMGGPSGGNGGRGGSVVMVCNPRLNTLTMLRRAVHHKAGDGSNGEGKSCNGAGRDVFFLYFTILGLLLLLLLLLLGSMSGQTKITI